MTPQAGNAPPIVGVYAADNGCFRGLDAPRYLRMLAALATAANKPLWVTVPDVVADAGETWAQWYRWQPVISSLGLPCALVLQDGIERLKWSAPLPSEWENIACVFVGGSTEFKLSDHAARLTLEAHGRGKLVHYGRVNTQRRILWLARGMRDGRLWCDSFDGSGWSMWGEKRIPRGVQWIDTGLRDRQTVLFGG